MPTFKLGSQLFHLFVSSRHQNRVITFGDPPADSGLDLFLFLEQIFKHCFSSSSFICGISYLYVLHDADIIQCLLESLTLFVHQLFCFFTTPSLCDTVSSMLLRPVVSVFDFSIVCLVLSLLQLQRLKLFVCSFKQGCFSQPPVCLTEYHAFLLVEIFFGRPLNERLS